jgi:hypothetical protein
VRDDEDPRDGRRRLGDRAGLRYLARVGRRAASEARFGIWEDKKHMVHANIFICYSTKGLLDGDVCKRIHDVELELLRNDGCTVWYDGDLDAGEPDWHRHIQHQLADSQLVIALISSAFFASKYIRLFEMPHLKDKVLPFIISDGHIKDHWLGQAQAVNRKSPLALCPNEGAVAKVYELLVDAVNKRLDQDWFSFPLQSIAERLGSPLEPPLRFPDQARLDRQWSYLRSLPLDYFELDEWKSLAKALDKAVLLRSDFKANVLLPVLDAFRRKLPDTPTELDLLHYLLTQPHTEDLAKKRSLVLDAVMHAIPYAANDESLCTWWRRRREDYHLS